MSLPQDLPVGGTVEAEDSEIDGPDSCGPGLCVCLYLSSYQKL